MIKKLGIIGVCLLVLAITISCEKDFNDIGTNIVNNGQFSTGSFPLELEIKPINLDEVRADNIGIGALGEYWLGVYNSGDYKTIEASFVSQLTVPVNFSLDDKLSIDDTTDESKKVDSVFTLDDVYLKIPYTAVNTRGSGDSEPKFRLDSVLGNESVATKIKVYRNNTFLNTLDPSNPAQSNKFLSNQIYEKVNPAEGLNDEGKVYDFIPNAKDTILLLKRKLSNGNTYNDTIKIVDNATRRITTPFIRIQLDRDKMKELFWDKRKDVEFETAAAFNDYFRGVIVEASGSDGSMVPLQLGSNAALDMYYTITTFEKKEGQTNLSVKDTLPRTYSFAFNGVKNSMYKMTAATNAAPAESFKIQGTAGVMAQVKVLGLNLNDADAISELKGDSNNNDIDDLTELDVDNNNYLDLKELAELRKIRNSKLLINDASLGFYVNQEISKDTALVPQRLFLYQNKDNGNAPTQITDAYREIALFGGNLQNADKKPEKYLFRITDYISDLFDGSTNDFSSLVLKVYNSPTDDAVKNNQIDENVSSRNWNPRGVTLLNGSTVNGAKKAVLKISFSKEKN